MNSSFDLNAYLMSHVLNSQEWHLPFFAPIPLPGFLSLHGLMIFIGAAILLILFLVLYRKQDRVPTGITNCLEVFVVFVRDEVAIPSLGQKDGILFTPMLCTIFFFILILNLLGLIPIFATATANVNVTGALAFLIFILLTIGTFLRVGIKGFWKAMVPSGLPIPLIPFFFVIEVVSLFIKSGALMIRLMANMMAGHMIILSLLGLIIMFGWFAAPALPIAVCIYGMEVFVAFLQAYVFILLSAIFIGQMYHPEH